MNSKLAGFWIMTRPLNLFLGGLSILIGALITGQTGPGDKILLACLSGVIIMAAGNVINDYFDVEIDRVNKPFRPLPSGQVGKTEALVFAIILFVLGIFLSILIGVIGMFIATFIAIGLIVYSVWLKRKILVGNIVVSLFAATAFIYGAAAVNQWSRALIPAGFAFLFHLGREIIKDVEDQAADESCLSQTLPIRYGRRMAFTIATIVFATLIVFTLIPYFLSIYGKVYFWTVLIGVDLVIALSTALMWLRPTPQSLRRISAVLKFDMFVGLFAILLGQPNLELISGFV